MLFTVYYDIITSAPHFLRAWSHNSTAAQSLTTEAHIFTSLCTVWHLCIVSKRKKMWQENKILAVKGNKTKLPVSHAGNMHDVLFMHQHVHTGMPLQRLHGGLSTTELDSIKLHSVRVDVHARQRCRPPSSLSCCCHISWCETGMQKWQCCLSHRSCVHVRSWDNHSVLSLYDLFTFQHPQDSRQIKKQHVQTTHHNNESPRSTKLPWKSSCFYIFFSATVIQWSLPVQECVQCKQKLLIDNSASSNGINLLKKQGATWSFRLWPLSSSDSMWYIVIALNIFWPKTQHKQFKDYNSGFRRQIQANNQENNQNNGNNRPRPTLWLDRKKQRDFRSE